MNPYQPCQADHEKGERCIVSFGVAVYSGVFFLLQAILFAAHLMYLIFLWIDNEWTHQAFISEIFVGGK